MKMNARMILRIVAVVVALGVFGWQWFGRRHAPKQPAASVVAAASAHAAASTRPASSAPAKPLHPAPPATVKMGSLTLTACALKAPETTVTTPAFCAKFPVPENRADPKARTIDLRLAIVKSSSEVPDKDLVVYLAGGPGQSAIDTYPEVARAFKPLLKHHDVLLLDQRGTGGSHPLLCPKAAKQSEDEPLVTPTPADRAKLVGECAAEVEKSADPRYYTTTDAVADLETVRQALGSPQLDLIGISYGTRMAQHYAMAHPKAVRSIVLDGVVPNTHVLGERFARALQHSLKLQAAACTATPACKQAFGDWYATLHTLYAKLQAAPPRQVTYPDPRTFKPVTKTLSADALASLARFYSYSAATQALLPLAVDQAAKGNFAPLLAQAGIVTSGVGESMQGGMQLSVVCTEDAPLLKPRPEDAGTLLGDQMIRALQAECGVWPHGPMPAGFHAAFKSSIPTLLISGERDPITPPSYATAVLQGLPDGRALVVKGMGHAESIVAGCMPTLVNEFVDKLDPKTLDARCLKKLGPIPAFINYNGAAP